MSGGANIVEQYAGADVPARIELLIKYYPNFIRLVEGYEQSLVWEIAQEVDCMLSSIYYGEIQSDKLVSWNENKDPYNILVENNRVYKLGGWEFLDTANKLFDMVLYLSKRCKWWYNSIIDRQ